MDASRPVARRAVAVALATTMAIAGPRPPLAAATTQGEEAMHRLINRARMNHDRPRLRLSQSLSRLAHRHSRRMADAGELFHHSCLACLLSDWEWDAIGENVGVGGTIRSVHRAFMDSDAHRRNILSRAYVKVGVGVVRADGRVWVTEIFMG